MLQQRRHNICYNALLLNNYNLRQVIISTKNLNQLPYFEQNYFLLIFSLEPSACEPVASKSNPFCIITIFVKRLTVAGSYAFLKMHT